MTWEELVEHEKRLGRTRSSLFRGSIQRTLKEEMGKVVAWSDATIRLLRFVWRGKPFLDWACFAGLTSDVLRLVLEATDPRAGAIPFAKAQTLTLCPDWHEENPKALAEAICSPRGMRFRDVYIMTLPEQAASAEVCRKTGQLYKHLVAHERCPTGEILLTGAYSSGLHERFWLPHPRGLTVVPRSRVVQFLLHNRQISPEGRVVQGSNTFQSFYLGDACLNPVKVVNGLHYFVEQTFHNPDNDELGPPWGDGLRLCLCMSRASSTLEQGYLLPPGFVSPLPPEAISPLPAEAYSIARATSGFRVHPEREHRSTNGSHSHYYSEPRDIDKENWTLVLEQTKRHRVALRDNPEEPDQPPRVVHWVEFRLRYGFVRVFDPERRFSLTTQPTRSSDHVRRDTRPIGECGSSWVNLETTDMTGFLLDTMGPNVDEDEWINQLESHDSRWAAVLRYRGHLEVENDIPIPQLEVLGPSEVRALLKKHAKCMRPSTEDMERVRDRYQNRPVGPRGE